MPKTLMVLQGGGPTAVINATLAGIAEQAAHSFDQLIGLRHSFERTDVKTIDLTPLLGASSRPARQRLSSTPGAYLGSSRKKVEQRDLEAMCSQLRDHGAEDIIGVGGNGTMYSLQKLSEFAIANDQPIRVVGAPKTVDNDIPGVEYAPGYGSAARFIAMAVRDYDCDFRAMSTFDDVTILETMGRNSGWLAAASTLLKTNENDAPHMVLVPEQRVDEEVFLQQVSALHKIHARVFIVTNEMLTGVNGKILGEDFQNGPTDELGRHMYSLSQGTGNYLTDLIWRRLGLQTRCLRPGNLGRASTSCVSEFDYKLAWNTGVAAVDLLNSGTGTADMLTIDATENFSNQSLEAGTGQKCLPDRYLETNQPFSVSPVFSNEARHVIGDVVALYQDDV